MRQEPLDRFQAELPVPGGKVDVQGRVCLFDSHAVAVREGLHDRNVFPLVIEKEGDDRVFLVFGAIVPHLTQRLRHAKVHDHP